MSIAAPAPLTSEDVFEYGPDAAALPAEAYPDVPAARLGSRYGLDLLRLPGARTYSWSGADLNTLYVNVASRDAAAAAVNVLEPVIDGVNLKVNVIDGRTRTPYTGPASQDIRDAAAAVNALPGIWNHRYNGSRVGGLISFRTVNESSRDHLDPLIRDKFEWGTTPSGRDRFMHVRFLPGVPPA